MAQYAIAFDLDNTGMMNAGFTRSQITTVYQTEIPRALTAAGFTAHPQGSLYHTEEDQNPITAIMQLQNILRTQAPQFCNYVKRVHVFRMEEWSDVTSLLATIPPDAPAPPPSAEEEIEIQEFINGQSITDIEQ